MKEVLVPACVDADCREAAQWELLGAEDEAELLCWSHGMIRFGADARQGVRPLELRRAGA